MKMYSKEGQCMVDVKKLQRKGDDLVMNCKLMGAYSMQIYLRPEELREAIKLLNWEAISYIPEMLIKGTKGEDKFREIGKNISTNASGNLQLIFGKDCKEKMVEVCKNIGVSTVQSLFENAMLLLQILLENKDTAEGEQQ